MESVVWCGWKKVYLIANVEQQSDFGFLPSGKSFGTTFTRQLFFSLFRLRNDESWIMPLTALQIMPRNASWALWLRPMAHKIVTNDDGICDCNDNWKLSIRCLAISLFALLHLRKKSNSSNKICTRERERDRNGMCVAHIYKLFYLS